jgi:hypothetical protein
MPRISKRPHPWDRLFASTFQAEIPESDVGTTALLGIYDDTGRIMAFYPVAL